MNKLQTLDAYGGNWIPTKELPEPDQNADPFLRRPLAVGHGLHPKFGKYEQVATARIPLRTDRTTPFRSDDYDDCFITHEYVDGAVNAYFEQHGITFEQPLVYRLRKLEKTDDPNVLMGTFSLHKDIRPKTNNLVF